MKYNGFSIDIEADGFVFEATKIWVINLEDLDTGDKLQLHPFRDSLAKSKLLDWVSKYDNPNVCFHNGLGYDIFVLMFILGIDYSVGPDSIEGIKVNFVDTFYLSMFLNPDREKHSIEYWGVQLGMPKIDFRDALISVGALDSNAPNGAEFLRFHSIMNEYCERDTLVGKLTFIALINEWVELYKSWDCTKWPEHFKAGQKAFYLMSCQELSGWKFDVDAAKELQIKIEQMMEEIRSEVEPQLPPRSLKKTEEKEYSMPAKPFKQDGSLSAVMEKWIAKHSATYDTEKDCITVYGKQYKIVAKQMLDIKLPMEMANQDQMKDWFLEQGWKPTLWNYKRGPDNKPIRDPVTRQLIPTTPKIQEAGKLCQNLEKIEGDLVKKVVKWLSLRNRQSVLNGWLENPRLQYDGRIGAGRTGIAATHRQKHKVVVNVPKADPKVLLGYEFRSLWITEDGMLIAAGDAAALEGRVQGHYTHKYDNGTTADELLKGDVHSKNANAFYGGIYDEVSKIYNAPDFDKENPKWKPYRNKSKNGFYCLPMHTKVLTSAGWKLFGDIEVGEALPTFNANTGLVEMDAVKALHHFDDTEVFKFSNKYDSFQCTENHRWYGWRRSKSKKGSKKIFGYFEAKDFTQEHNLLLTAAFTGNDGCTINETEAKFMGYLLSDGSYKWSDKSSTTSSSFGKKKAISMQVCQSRNKFWEDIQNLIDALGMKYNLREEKKENGNNVLHWKISQPDARSFIDRVVGNRLNKHEVNWSEWVMKLSRKSLEAFYEGFYNGDGNTTGNHEVVSQNTGKVHEGIVTAMQLLGKGRVTLNNHQGWKDNICQGIRVQKRKHLTMQEQSKESLGIQETFCLTTGNSSFIIWQDDFIGITGNCILYGGGAPKVASTLGIPEKYGKEALEAFWEANPGTKDLKENLEKYWEGAGKKKYLPAIDGRILMTRKKSALLNTIFQSCGGITMDYAGCFMDKWLGGMQWDEKRRPFYLYKGFTVRRIGYIHDELEYECDAEIANEVAGMIEKSIAKAGEYLGIKVPLVGEGKVGKNWKEVH
jgi:hypothetical protein